MANNLSTLLSGITSVGNIAPSRADGQRVFSSYNAGKSADRAQLNLRLSNIEKAKQYKTDAANRTLALKLAATQRSEDMKYRFDTTATTNANREAARVESARRYKEGLTRQDDILAAEVSVGDITVPRNVTVDNTPLAIYALDEAIAKAEQNGTPMKLGEGLSSIPQQSTIPEQSEFLAMYNGIKNSPNMSDVEKRIALRDIGATQQARLTEGTDSPTNKRPLVDESSNTDDFRNSLETLGNSSMEIGSRGQAYLSDLFGLGTNTRRDQSILDREIISKAHQDKIKDTTLSTLEQVDKMARDEPARMKKEADAKKARMKKEAKDVVETNRIALSKDPSIIKSKELIIDSIAKAPKTTKDRRTTLTEAKKYISEARKEFKASFSDTLTSRQKDLRVASFNKVARASLQSFNLEEATINKGKREAAKLESEQSFKIFKDNNKSSNDFNTQRILLKLENNLPLSVKDKSIIHKNNSRTALNRQKLEEGS
jgi:hypothetical protein